MFIIIKINENQRFNKIVINKFVRYDIERYKRIIRSNLLTIHYITFINVFLDDTYL